MREDTIRQIWEWAITDSYIHWGHIALLVLMFVGFSVAFWQIRKIRKRAVEFEVNVGKALGPDYNNLDYSNVTEGDLIDVWTQMMVIINKKRKEGTLVWTMPGFNKD